MLRYQVALSDISFKVMGANLRLFKAMHLPVISTARPFDFYRKVFFEDACQADVLSSLASKRVVDIGCGLTPFTEDSMFQVCRRSGVDFYGIDPKLADGFKFGLFDRLKSVATGATSMPRADMPGQEKASPWTSFFLAGCCLPGFRTRRFWSEFLRSLIACWCQAVTSACSPPWAGQA